MGVITPSGYPSRHCLLCAGLYVDFKAGDTEVSGRCVCVCESASDLCSSLGAESCVSLSTGITVAQNPSAFLHVYQFSVRSF